MKIIQIFGILTIMMAFMPGVFASTTVVPAHYNISIYSMNSFSNSVTIIKLNQQEINFFDNNTNYLTLKYLNGNNVTFYYYKPYLVIYSNMSNGISNIQMYKQFSSYRGKNDSGILTAWGHADVAIWGFLGKDIINNIQIPHTGEWTDEGAFSYSISPLRLFYNNFSIAVVAKANYSYGAVFRLYNSTNNNYVAMFSLLNPNINYFFVSNSTTHNYLFYTLNTFKEFDAGFYNNYKYFNGLISYTGYDIIFDDNVDKIYIANSMKYGLLTTDNYSLSAYYSNPLYTINYIPSQYILDNQQFVFLMSVLVIILLLAIIMKSITIDFLLIFIIVTYWYYSFVTQNVMLVLAALSILIAFRDIASFFTNKKEKII